MGLCNFQYLRIIDIEQLPASFSFVQLVTGSQLPHALVCSIAKTMCTAFLFFFFSTSIKEGKAPLVNQRRESRISREALASLEVRCDG